MSTRRLVSAGVLSCLAALAAVVTVAAWQPAASPRFYVAGDAASSLIEKGLAAPAPTGSRANEFEVLPAPGVRFIPTVARATNVPWLDTNAHQYRRGVRKASYPKLPEGSAALAAAEAFVFDAEAILNPDPADLEDLESMLRFLKDHARPALPPLVNIGIEDDGSAGMTEVLKMLSRRNLLYRIVEKPEPSLDLNVHVGTKEFPEEAAGNPYDFAVLVRGKLGDDKRLVRLYGTNTVLAHLTGDGERARLFLLQYRRSRRERPGRSDPQTMQVRVLGQYQPTSLAAYGLEAGATLTDVQQVEGATEFWVPSFDVLAIVDLEARK